MDKVELKFLRITYSHTHAGAYALILAEAQGDRRLPIIIGGVEAQAIAIQVENIKPARPLTHDLFKNVADTLGFNLKEVIINDLVEGIFHAKLVVEQDAREVTIDARSSDAIALALRFDCPIYTYEPILGAAGLKVEEGEEEQAEGEVDRARTGVVDHAEAERERQRRRVPELEQAPREPDQKHERGDGADGLAPAGVGVGHELLEPGLVV